MVDRRLILAGLIGLGPVVVGRLAMADNFTPAIPKAPKMTPSEIESQCRFLASELKSFEKEHKMQFDECTDLKKRIADDKKTLSRMRQERRASNRAVKEAERIVEQLEDAKAKGKTGTTVKGMGLRDARANLKERKRVLGIDIARESAVENGIENLEDGLKECLKRLKFLADEIRQLRAQQRSLAC